jgi:hypothetical protein
MMPIILQERFEQLLRFAKDPAFRLTARENIAAAKELVETLMSTGHLEIIEYKAYRSMITTAGIMVGNDELRRSLHLPDVRDCANGRMHDASKNLVTKMPGGYIA